MGDSGVAIIIATSLAAAAASFSAIAAVLQVYLTHKSQTTKLSVDIFLGDLIGGGEIQENQVCITVANIGMIPVTITHIGGKQPKQGKKGGFLLNIDGIPKVLNVGEVFQNVFPLPSDYRNHNFKTVYAIDSSGRNHYARAKRVKEFNRDIREKRKLK